MSEIKIVPFRGLRYHPHKISDISRVVAPPYDVISEDLQKKLYAQDPYNVVRLILGHQFPNDSETNNRYTRAAADLSSWIREGVLVRDEAPSFYLYEQTYSSQGKTFSRRGFLALRRLEDFKKGKIHPHEKTLAGPKADRLLLMKSCAANLSPIFSLYSDPERRMENLLQPYFQKPPLVELKDEEGTGHRLWSIADQRLFEETNRVLGEKNLFIADGHHRYETAMNYRDWMKQQYPSASEDAPFHFVMMFFAEMSDPGLQIFPTHRVLKDWPSFEKGSFEKRLKEFFQMRTYPAGERESFLKDLQRAAIQGPALGLVLPSDPQLRLLSLEESRLDHIPSLESLSPILRRVDTAVLHHLIFKNILGLSDEDQKDPKHIRFVKDKGEAFQSVNEPGVHGVFLLNSPSMPVLKKVVEAGLILPPKTTYFYPKLLSGLVMNQIDPKESVAT